MVKETHIKGGYLFAIAAIPFVSDKYLESYDNIYKIILIMIYIYFAYLGSLFPDIDMKGSYISKKFPLLYKVFGKNFRHRSFTHSLLSLILLNYILEIFIHYTLDNIVFLCVSCGFMIGYVSHICFDLITKEGIEIFYPLSINFSILPIKTSSKTEKIFAKALGFVIVFLLGYRFYMFV